MKLSYPSSLVANGLKIPYSYRVDELPRGQEARVLKCGRKERNWFYFRRRSPEGELVKSPQGYRSEFEALEALHFVVWMEWQYA
jgi:hypothetical protein